MTRRRGSFPPSLSLKELEDAERSCSNDSASVEANHSRAIAPLELNFHNEIRERGAQTSREWIWGSYMLDPKELRKVFNVGSLTHFEKQEEFAVTKLGLNVGDHQLKNLSEKPLVIDGEETETASTPTKTFQLCSLITRGQACDCRNRAATTTSSSRELMKAVQEQHTSLAKKLLDLRRKEATFRVECSYCLLLALKNAHFELMDYCLQSGADVKYLHSWHPLKYLVRSDGANPEALEFVLRYGPKLHFVFADGSTHHGIAKVGNVELLKRFLAGGADMNGHEPITGMTPLMIAILYNNLECVKFLLQEGVDIHCLDFRGHTALHIAAMKGYTTVAELLQKRGGGFMSVDLDHCTPWCLAIANGHPQTANFLLPAHNIDHADENRRTQLHYAAWSGNLQGVTLLLEKGANTNGQDSNKETPLFLAVQEQHHDVQKCLASRTNLELTNQSNQTVFSQEWNRSSPSVQSLRILKNAGAKLELMHGDYENPLLQSVDHQEYPRVRLLLGLGIDSDYVDKRNQTALWYACKNGDAKMLKLLITAGVDPRLGDLASCVRNRPTPIVLIVRHRSLVMLKALVSAGCRASSLQGVDIEAEWDRELPTKTYPVLRRRHATSCSRGRRRPTRRRERVSATSEDSEWSDDSGHSSIEDEILTTPESNPDDDGENDDENHDDDDDDVDSEEYLTKLKKLLVELRERAYTPITLQDCCKIAIRTALRHTDIESVLSHLPLPPDFIRYLSCHHVDDIFSSSGQRPDELMPWRGVRRPSSVAVCRRRRRRRRRPLNSS